MKSRIAVCIFSLSVAVLSLSLGGCTGNMETSDPSSDQQISSPVSDGADNSDASGGSGSSDIPSSSDNSDIVPKPKKPEGEPTFLTAPDGTPIYTSEISEIYKGSEEWGDKEAITLEQAEQFAKEGSDFSVKCNSFAYGYTSEGTLNRVDNPEMFKDIGNGKSFEFLGEDFDVNTFEGKYSTDYTRIKVGDKFGSLTVKSAYTLFSRRTWFEGEDFSNVPGVYLSGAGIEFDGEIEMTGYVAITPMDTLYNEGGDMEFIPNRDSSLIIPKFEFFLNKKARCVCHFPHVSGSGYCGTTYNIGNMYEVACDTSGLNPGDSFVKVKVVLDNVKYAPGRLGAWSAELKHIEVI